jgi:alpha-1,3-rhamnosyl/mannosyltransferase
VIQDPWNGLLLRGVRLFHSMGIWLPRTPRVPKLVTIHDLNPVRNPQWVRAAWSAQRSALIRRTLERADHVVTYSAFTAGEIQEEFGLPADRVHPVPLGVDTAAFRPLPAAALAAMRQRLGRYAMAVGLLTPRKNFERLVEAVAGIADLRLLVVGRSSNGAEDFWRAVERHKMRERVTHLEKVSHEELVELMNGAQVFVVPSLYEGFGLTVLEAMACGVPVVCSNATSLPEVAGGAACSVDACRSDALEEALRRVVGSPELAADLRERGLARARTMSWPAAARRLRTLYRQVAGT